MNTEVIAYAEARIQGLKEAEKDALANLARIQGGILEWEYYVQQQQAPLESAGDAAALTGDPGKAVPLELVGPDGTTVSGRGVLLAGENGRTELMGEQEGNAPEAPAAPSKKGGAR